MREALVAQGRRERLAAERPGARGEAQEQARLERLAFSGDLRRVRAILRSGHHSEGFVWLRAYVACATGDLDSAAVSAVALAASASDLTIRVRAAVTAGSALRQLGHYDQAASIERRALRLGREPAHLRISLAADAVGLGDVRACARELAAAQAALAARDPRARIRLDWVRCEHALLRADAHAAAGWARSALRRSRAAGVRRPPAKAPLFFGAPLAENN